MVPATRAAYVAGMNRPLPPLNPDMFADCDGYPVPVGVGGKWTAKVITCLEDGGKDDSAPEGPRVAVLNAGFVGEARRP